DERLDAKLFGACAHIAGKFAGIGAKAHHAETQLIAAHPRNGDGVGGIAKRLGIGCAVISAPVHVQDFPARYSPVMGFEGANVLFDTLVHPLTMGLEEHLLTMFREDFEFSDDAGASHLGAHAGPPAGSASSEPAAPEAPAPIHIPEPAGGVVWEEAATKELKKIPFFVRGRARANTEKFAAERGISAITVETLYDAKAHFGR
ncbi:MAG: ferredoxin:protochlorophyllide reductase (ATP-dependent) subunit B, partial [Pseudomonadota bacterium]